MPKAKINVNAIIKESKATNEIIKTGIANAKLNKKEKQELINDLKEVIVLAENMKNDIENEINKRA